MMNQVFLRIFLHWGLQVLSIVMLLGDEFVDLLKDETNCYGDVKQLSKIR